MAEKSVLRQWLLPLLPAGGIVAAMVFLGRPDELFEQLDVGARDDYATFARDALESGRPQQAVRILESRGFEHLKLDDLLTLAQAQSELVDVPAARRALDRAQQLDPESPQLWLSECIFAYDTSDFDAALTACTRSIELYGDDVEYHAWLNRGLTRIKLGDLDGAYADFQECKQLDPENAEAYYDESWVWAARGNLEKVIENVRLAGRYEPYYASYETVAFDEPYRHFRGDPRWEAFLQELHHDEVEWHIPALLQDQPVNGVPLQHEAQETPPEDGGQSASTPAPPSPSDGI